MKLFFAFLLITLVTICASAPAPEEESDTRWGPLYIEGTPCPAKNFYSECNSCFCLEDGKSAGCTLMACEPFNPALKP
ncbi:serine protease inhibitor I/II-like [Leptopilina boulardi]|uniref:serine protease inhibitor I/II-like n=1 Tax=Leptopilina boulardi TaxID=63433 RepID=UPI0021F6128C|nr:serine protease inhibitor I/II-like [Leptopilina boulardi]